MSRRLKAGSVFVNNYNDGDMTVPFGGYKQSGNGRDKSLHALEKFTELKTIWIARVSIMTEHTTSYYAASANAYEPFPTLNESISCDVRGGRRLYRPLLRAASRRNGLRRGAP